MKTQVLRTRSLVPVMVGAWMALLGLMPSPAAVAQSEIRLADIARSEFSRPRTISGVGLVTGLQGTGDTGKNLAAARLYAEMLRREQVVDETDLPESILKAGSIALVKVTATIQIVEQGGRYVPCSVSVAGGGATSLEGGRLWVTPLREDSLLLADAERSAQRPIAFAQGLLQVSEDAPTTGRIAGENQGALVVPTSGTDVDPATGRTEFVDFYDNPYYRGRREVLFDIRNAAHRTGTNAARLADAINEELMEDGFVHLASIASESGVIVRLPDEETDAFRFAARLEQMMVDFRIIEVPATIRWSESTGVLVVTGNTRLLDASVAVEGFQIQRLEPARPATLENPDVRLESSVILSGRETPSLSLQALKQQLEKLQVPARQQADVLRQLCDTGMLNATFEDVDNS